MTWLNPLNYMDFIAAALELLGIWIVGNKDRRGFLLLLACGLCWLVVCCFPPEGRGPWGLMLVVIPAMIVNVRNYIKWGKE